MPDEFFTRPPAAQAAPRRRSVFKRLLAGTGLIVVGGAALAGWLFWSGHVHIDGTGAGTPFAAPPAPAPSLPVAPSPASADPARLAIDEQRIAELDARLARITAAADAVEAKTQHADALVLVLAVRRAAEHGARLGVFAGALKERFGASQSAALAVVLDPVLQPVTLGQLDQKLDQIDLSARTSQAQTSSLARLRSEISALFVVHKGNAQTPRDADRLMRARALLHMGQTDAASSEVAMLPVSDATREWLAAARRFAAVAQALDQLDAEALAPQPAAIPAAAVPAAAAPQSQPEPRATD